MSSTMRLQDLLRRWHELRQSGQVVSVEELCRDCPELADVLRRHIEVVDARYPPAASTAPSAAKANEAPSTPTGAGSSRQQPRDFQLQAGAEPVPGYRLQERLGRGGFGEVWKALGPSDFPLALKFVPLGDQAGPIELRSLELMKGIRHPHLLALFGAWQVGDFLIVAMELADRTLMDRFQEAVRAGQTGIPAAELMEYMHDAARAIDFLNEPRHTLDGREGISIQHRDLKPQNLLLVGGSVKVADFGLARFLEHTVTSHTGGLTPAFAAPEFFNAQTSLHSDQYSLAATYCFLRGGRLPFTGTPAQIMAGHLTRPPDLSQLPAAEHPTLLRALAKEPLQRWPSCRAFVQAIAGSAAGAGSGGPPLKPVPPPAPPPPSSSTPVAIPAPAPRRAWRRTAGIASMLSAFVLVGAGAAVYFSDWRPDFGTPQAATSQRSSSASLPRETLPTTPRETLVASQPLPTRATQPPKPPDPVVTTGTVRVMLDDGGADVTLRLDGKPLDRKALEQPIPLPVGDHRLQVTADEIDSVDRPFPVKAGENTALTITLTVYGKLPLTIDAEDPQVEIDGKVVAAWKTPLRLAVGPHRLRVTGTNMVPVEQAVTVKRGTNPAIDIKPEFYQRITVDPSAAVEVRVDGKEVRRADLDKPLAFRPGLYQLTVTGDEYEPVSLFFTVRSGANPAVTVSLVRARPSVETLPAAFVVRVRSVDSLLASAGALTNRLGTPEQAEQFKTILNGIHDQKLLDGLDLKKPLGAYGNVDADGAVSFVLMAPVTGEKAFLSRLDTFGFKVMPGEGGLSTIASESMGFTALLRFANGYAYAAPVKDRAALAQNRLLAPAKVFAGDEKSSIFAACRVDAIPAEVKRTFLAAFEKSINEAMDKRLDESEAQRQLRRALLKWFSQQTTAVIEDGAQVAVHLDYDVQTRSLTTEVNLTGKAKSRLAGRIATLGGSRSLFAAMPGPDSAMSGHLCLSWPEEIRAPLAAVLDEAFEKTADGIADRDRRRVVEQLFAAVAPSLKASVLDVGMDFRGGLDDKRFNALFGFRLAEGRKVERAFRELSQDKTDIRLDAAREGGIGIHRIDVANNDLTETTRRMFGENPIYLAFTPDAFLLAIGEGGLSRLRAALKYQPADAPPLQFSLSAVRLVAFSDSKLSDADQREIAALRDADRINFTLEGGKALRVRLTMKDGALKVFSLVGQKPAAPK